MEKQKKIKITKVDDHYEIRGNELIKLQNIIRDGFIKYYNWILKETGFIVLSKESIQEITKQWKNKKNV